MCTTFKVLFVENIFLYTHLYGYTHTDIDTITATVSFDAALDLAIEVNLLGPTRIAETLQDLGVAPHMVAVSTCYVAGNRRAPGWWRFY